MDRLDTAMRLVTHIDDQLREVVVDEQRLAEAIRDSEQQLAYLREQAEEDASTLDTTRLARRLQRHGRLLRFAGKFEQATGAKHEAIQIWRRCDRRRAHFLCRLQAATIRFEADDAQTGLEAATRLAEELDDHTEVYLDMLEELLGKCHFGCANFQQAKNHLENALEVRRQRGNERHIRRTQQMIERVEQLMTSGNG